MDSLPPASIPGSVLQRSSASRNMGQGGDAAVAIDMDNMDARPTMSNDMSQMQLVEQQVRSTNVGSERLCSDFINVFSKIALSSSFHRRAKRFAQKLFIRKTFI